jgi:hypothetical protein
LSFTCGKVLTTLKVYNKWTFEKEIIIILQDNYFIKSENQFVLTVSANKKTTNDQNLKQKVQTMEKFDQGQKVKKTN